MHLIAWAILLIVPIYFIQRWQIGNDFIWFYYINAFINGAIFYINYFLLVPKLFYNKNNYRYYLSVIVLLIFFYFITEKSNDLVLSYYPTENNLTEKEMITERGIIHRRPDPPGVFPRPPFRQIHLFNYGFNSMFLIFFSLGLKVIERHSQVEKLQKELEREKLNSELALLKNQISPHFFFNTLNNVYSLIGINPSDSQKAILKLSKLMRYLLYESEHGNTPLSNEIDFMKNYIDLMKLRMSDKVNLLVSFPENFNEISIPPLLFIPFIENAFKHGISYRGKSYINVSMQVMKDSIAFRCANSIGKSSDEPDRIHSGIGLENVSKRLVLLFPDKHELKINKTDTEFEVLLFISIA